MDNNDLNLNSDDSVQKSGTDRRSFLGGAGVLGFAAMAGMLNSADAKAATPQTNASARLSSIDKLNVTRNETYDVPGGKEYFLDWQINDDKGVVKKVICHHTRLDSDVTYTMASNIVIHTFNPGMDINGSPASTKHQNVTVYAVKGEVVGPVRNDHVTITTIHRNGSSSRLSKIVPVRLEIPEFANMDIETMITNIGHKFIHDSR